MRGPDAFGWFAPTHAVSSRADGDIDIYFSQYFDVDPDVLEDYGAFDISVVSDLPLFVDPFLLFNSDDADYQQLHERDPATTCASCATAPRRTSTWA